MRRFLNFLSIPLILAIATAQANDMGVYSGLAPSNATLLQFSLGNDWRFLGAVTLSHDRDFDSDPGNDQNNYNYMAGIGYRFSNGNHFLEFGPVYVERATDLFDNRRGAAWIRYGYRFGKDLFLGVAHQSVPFVDDHGRNQVGMSWGF